MVRSSFTAARQISALSSCTWTCLSVVKPALYHMPCKDGTRLTTRSSPHLPHEPRSSFLIQQFNKNRSRTRLVTKVSSYHHLPRETASGGDRVHATVDFLVSAHAA
ncbi:hypothetical protein L227DRAFT_423252 [Lentinus tigrinus ALCF2SS1-6]|uniref:Uncharacterized protein n=1 Tax=Lentinus tigrinus ALCF2SS1-6 TaxID=1328759 RepID=A0A5C2RS71_9APHY|nr:hypothetical protein L227DRAFT_423252 [Lentinus tigrinus ALCF2SS1-6]